MGEVPISYNANINLYEAQFNKTKAQFFKYFMGDPATLSQLSDAYSVEVFCRNSSALPTSSTRPIGMVNGYGFGLQMNDKGNIAYTTTTQGSKADGTFAKTQWSWIDASTLTADYTHYCIVYDRKNYLSQLYINGELASTRLLTFKECPVYEWTPSTWLAIGGDAYGTYDASAQTGSYPFMGDVALVRVYGRALSQAEVQGLYGILGTQKQSYTLGTSGYAAVCLPYVWQVPEGCKAYIVTAIASQFVMLKAIAEAGEYVPYGPPVLLKAEAQTAITLRAENKESLPLQGGLEGPANLLVGTYPGKKLAEGEGYYMKTNGTNFYRAAAAVTLPPFSCYMPSTEKRSYFKLEEAPDGINEPAKSKQQDECTPSAIFDLSGRSVNGPLKQDVYIVGSKKVLVK